MAHQDVVPALEDGWIHPSFSGDIVDGYVWGRGAFDMKCQLAAILQAAEELLSEGFVPRRDVYFCFTHNEESSDETGAKAAAGLLAGRGIRFSVAIDEGGYAFNGEGFGMKKDGIFVSLCEKGYADIEIEANSPDGSTLCPPGKSALTGVCRAIAAIEANPPSAHKNPASKALIKALSSGMPVVKRAGLRKRMQTLPSANALVRSTIAPTMIKAEDRTDVFPREAKAILNARLLPGQPPEEILEHCRHAAKDVGVTFRLIKANPATAVSPPEGEEYGRIVRALRFALPELVPIPGIMTAATDSRFFSAICKTIYRVSPFSCAREVLSTMHAANERVSVKSLYEGKSFFKTLITTF